MLINVDKYFVFNVANFQSMMFKKPTHKSSQLFKEYQRKIYILLTNKINNYLKFTSYSLCIYVCLSSKRSPPLLAPAIITNTHVIVECNYTLYSCRDGYYSNGASSCINYDGQAWSSKAMECKRKCICLFKVILKIKLFIGLLFCQKT